MLKQRNYYPTHPLKMKSNKAIFVSEETHKKFKLKAVEAGQTFDEYLNLLMDFPLLREIKKQ